MSGLKTLVVTMGLLIVVGLVLVGYGLTRGRQAPPPPPPSAAPAAAGYFASDLPVPRGAKLVAVSTAGDRIVLHFAGSDGDKLLLLDAHSGQVTGTVNLVAEKN
jgi:hypothetical protein